MKTNKEQFIQDILDTFSNPKTYLVCLLMCALFGLSGLVFSLISLQEVLNYFEYYAEYQTFFGLSIFCIIGGIGTIIILLKYYALMYKESLIKERIKCMPAIFACMIPGFLMMVYVAMIKNIEITLSLAHFCFISCLYAVVVILISYVVINNKLISDKFIYQKKTLRDVERILITVMATVLVIALLLQGTAFIDIPKVILIIFVVTFLSYQCGRTLVALKLLRSIDMDYLNYQNPLYYDGTLGDNTTVKIARVTVINSGQLDKAVNILTEFGFSKEECTHAIIKNLPFFTFDERMYYDISIMEKILSRLAYEDIPFKVEIFDQGNWLKTNEYDEIEKCCYVRRVKNKNDDKAVSDEKKGFIANFLGILAVIIILLCYGIWTAVFPANFFRPVRWSSLTQIQNNYREFTYYSGRTVYHSVCVWLVVTLFLLLPAFSSWYCQLVQADLYVIYFSFIIIFIGELFVFPLYLKHLKDALNKKNNTVHNYEKNAMKVFIAVTFFRILSRGWKKSLAMIALLIIAIEAAKSIIIVIRYLRHAKEIQYAKEDKYEIVDLYAEEIEMSEEIEDSDN